MPKNSELETTLAFQIRAAGLPEPVRYYKDAIPGRKFEFDFAWPSCRLLVEVQGGEWAGQGPNQQGKKWQSGHKTGQGITRDAEKSVLASIAGWHVWPVTGGQVTKGIALTWLQTWFEIMEGK